MPQIDQIMSTYGSQLFWLVITFGLIYFVIGRSMLPKIQSTVDAREKRIADDLEAARMAHARADELEEDYKARQAAGRDEAQAIVAQAKQESAKKAEKRLKDADARMAEKIAAAESAIEGQRQSALSELEDVATEAAQSIIAKMTKAKVTKTQVRSAVKGALKNG